jgi:hypothetical protein
VIPAGATTFAVPTAIAEGAPFAIKVISGPTGPPLQVCTVNNGSGTVGSGTVDVSIICGAAPTEELLGLDSNGNLHGILIDPATGALGPIGPVVAGAVTSLAVHPGGSHVYATMSAGNSVGAFTIDSSGSLSAIAGSPFASPVLPNGLVVDSAGSRLFAASSAGFIAYQIASPSGALSMISGSPFAAPSTSAGVTGATTCANGCVASDGYLYYAAFTNDPAWCVLGYAVDGTSGALLEPGFLFGCNSNAAGISGLALDSGGNALYVAEVGTGLLEFNINTTTGQPSSATDLTASGPDDTSVWPVLTSGNFLYAYTNVVGGASNGYIAGYQVPTSGLAAALPNTTAFAAFTPGASVGDRSGRFVYFAGTDAIYGFSVDPATGKLAPTPGSPYATSVVFGSLVAAAIP